MFELEKLELGAFVRLTDTQQKGIVDTFLSVFDGIEAELWLFGSRVDDTKRGGDIDLLIKCYSLSYHDLSILAGKYDFLLQKRIGARKIDMVLDFDLKHSNRPIIIQANKEGILLSQSKIN